MPRRRLVISLVALAVIAALVAVMAYVVWPRGSELEEAASRLPDSTLRVTWTDWAGVRAELDAGDVPATGAETEEFLGEAADRDLSSASPTASYAVSLYETFGFTPVTSEWELLGQGPEGMVLVLRLGADADLGDIADRFRAAGYTAPGDDRLDGGVWQGGPDVLTRTGLDEPVLQHVAFFEDEHLLATSDGAGYLEEAVPVVGGDEDGLDLSALTGPVDDPLASIAFAEDLACQELTMGLADEGAQAQADLLVEDAGGIAPLTGYLVALQPGRRMTVVYDFEDEDRAEANVGPRRTLAGAEDPAQLVVYPELFTVDEAEQDGTRVVLRLEEVAEDGYPLTNTTQGAVLLAAC